MIKRILGGTFAAMMLLGCVSYAAEASLVKGADIWTKTFITEQNRLYPNTTDFTSKWPAYGGLSCVGSGAETAVTEESARTVKEVFGEESLDLQFTDITSSESFESYMADDMSMANIYYCDMKEWNGFLFVLVCGYEKVYNETSVTDYNGNAVPYTAALRPVVQSNPKMDSYLYVFDISKAENYGKARYARWSKNDLGLTELDTQIMDKIDVDDNYIYLTVSNGGFTSSLGNTAYKNCRGLAVFKNNIKRGAAAAVPNRAESDYEEFPYGVRIVQNSINNRTTAYSACNINKSAVINGKHILWYSAKTSLISSSSKTKESMFVVNDIFGSKGSKVYYTTSSYGASLGALLSCPDGDWNAVENPMIKAIVNDGHDFYFLVTYTGDKDYSVIYKTDWSDPYNPTLADTYKYSFGGSDITVDTRLMKYGKRLYVCHDSGLDIIIIGEGAEEKYSLLNTIAYSSEVFKVMPKAAVRLAAAGNYLYIWYNVGSVAYDVKVEIDETGTPVNYQTGTGARQKPFDDVKVYGSHMYIPAFLQSPSVYRQNIVRVDISNIIPVSLEIDPYDKSAVLPYAIKGTGTNIDYVSVNDNGTVTKVKAALGEDGLKHWSYIITEEGQHSITLTGEFIEDNQIEETAEYISLNAFYVEAGAVYSADDTTITAKITLSGTESIPGTAVVAIYSVGELTSVKTCDITKGAEIEFSKPEGDYSIKTFFFDKSGELNTLYEAVSAQKTEIEG